MATNLLRLNRRSVPTQGAAPTSNLLQPGVNTSADTVDPNPQGGIAGGNPGTAAGIVANDPTGTALPPGAGTGNPGDPNSIPLPGVEANNPLNPGDGGGVIPYTPPVVTPGAPSNPSSSLLPVTSSVPYGTNQTGSQNSQSTGTNKIQTQGTNNINTALNTSGTGSTSSSPTALAGINALIPQLGAQTTAAGNSQVQAQQTAQNALNPILESPGYTAGEQAATMVTPEERNAQIDLAEAPVTGAADQAKQNLLQHAAAAGGYAPGLNATEEEINREEGRNASSAALTAGQAADAANRAAAANAANARISQQQFGSSQAGTLSGQANQQQQALTGAQSNLLVNDPNKTSATGSTEAGTTNQQTSGTTNQQTTGSQNSGSTDTSTPTLGGQPVGTSGGGVSVGAGTTGSPSTVPKTGVGGGAGFTTPKPVTPTSSLLPGQALVKNSTSSLLPVGV